MTTSKTREDMTTPKEDISWTDEIWAVINKEQSVADLAKKIDMELAIADERWKRTEAHHKERHESDTEICTVVELEDRYRQGFIDGSDATGEQAMEICAIQKHEAYKRGRAEALKSV